MLHSSHGRGRQVRVSMLFAVALAGCSSTLDSRDDAVAPIVGAPAAGSPALPAGGTGSIAGRDGANAGATAGAGMRPAGAGGTPSEAGAAGMTPASDDAGTSPTTPPPLPPPLERVSIGMNATGAHADLQVGEVVRFIAVGDTGTGDENQHRVAGAMVDKCKSDGCDFVLLLGDNFYDHGLASADDPQLQTKFEQPYAELDVPFFAVLGNHDTGVLFGAGYRPEAIPWEIDYTEVSDKWTMPAPHYTVSAGSVGLLVLDSTALYSHAVIGGDQRTWIDAARDGLLAKHGWVFAAAHHPYLADGDHGNAGAYAALELDSGADIQAFIEGEVCGQLDIYLSGHDHIRQWLDPSQCGGTDLIVSGAGAKTHALQDRGNVSLYRSNALGFLYVVVDGTTLTGQFIDEHGGVSFERSIQK